jgi:hypothetical protein
VGIAYCALRIARVGDDLRLPFGRVSVLQRITASKMNESPSMKHYEPVLHQEDLHNDCSDEEDDFHHIRIEKSNDSDDKTAPTSNIHHHLSFDLEEEEDELQRYRLPNPGSREIPKKLTLTSLWQMYLDARVEGRRRRAEQLLENDSPLICISSWCDLTDRGLFLFILLFVAWIVACVQNKSLLVGGLFFAFRLFLRPAYWLIWGRRVEQKRQETMAIYDELNGNFDANNVV